MKKEGLFRGIYYCLGMLILALGLVLNTKSGLGVSAIMSVPYSISLIWGFNFGNVTLMVYCLFVLIEFVLKGRSAKALDLLQVPLSIVFTRFINLFDQWLPLEPTGLLGQSALLILAVALTGIGAAMTVNMRLIPNPGDGLVQAVSDKTGKELGLTKNLVDMVCIAVSFVIGLVFSGGLAGIGVGTVVSVIGVGRVIATFNHFFKVPMCRLAGMA